MKTRIIAVLSLLVISLVPMSPSSAAWLSYQSSPNDRFNASDVKPEYDLVSVDIGILDTSPNEVFFFLEFVKPVFNSQFADGKGSWAAIMLDMNNDGKVDYSMETSNKSYVSNYYHNAIFSDRSGFSPVPSTRCAPITWSDLGNNVKWIGFRLQKTCLNFDITFGVRGHADFNSSDQGTNDWAPDEFWKVNLSGGVIPTPTPTPTATTDAAPLALINARNASSDATNAAEEAFEAFSAAKSDCDEISNTFEDSEVMDLYDSTSLNEYCNQFDLEASSLDRKISALDPQAARTVDAANKETDAANKLAEAADSLVAKMQDIIDELSATESMLAELVVATNFFNNYDADSIEQINLLKERIGMLPPSLQSTLKRGNEFKALASFQRQIEGVVKSKDAILEVFTGVKRPSQITPTLNSINSLKSQLPSLNTLKKSIQNLEKKIPATVCQKGSLVVSTTKTGKCAKGFEAIPTK
jgi:hypothetical protein